MGLDGRRKLVAAAACAVLVGIAMSVTSLREVGSVMTTGALVVLIAALHRLGRSGPDGAAERSAARP